MELEYTTQSHVEDGMLHVPVPEDWNDMDVTVTVEPASEAKEAPPAQNLAEALDGRIGLFSFGPTDLASRSSEAYATSLDEKYQQTSGQDDAV